MRDGVPLERMAVLYGRHEPYARLVHEQLDLAGIRHNGAAVRTLDGVGARPRPVAPARPRRRRLRRDDVCALLRGACPCSTVTAFPSPRWRGIASRARPVSCAGVASGRRGSRRTPRNSVTTSGASANGRGCTRSRRSSAVSGRSSTPAAPRPRGRAWPAGRTVSRARSSGPTTVAPVGPRFEQEAARRVEAAVDRLGALDTVDHAPSVDAFRRALALELDAARDRVGRLGEGVLAGPVGLALGVELERVWICGLAEGVFPSVPHDDPLLADADRAALDGRAAAARVARRRRSPRAARRVRRHHGRARVRYPRGDLRRTTERTPSRFSRGDAARRSTTPQCTSSRRTSHALDARRVPGHRARARGAGRGARSGLGADRCPPSPAGASLIAARAGVRRSRASTATSRACGARLRGDQPGRGTPDLADAARGVGGVPARVLRRLRCCTSKPSSGPKTSCSSRRSIKGSLVHEVLDASCRAPTMQPVDVDDVGSGAAARDRARRVRRVEARGLAGRPAAVAARAAAACSPSSTRSSSPTTQYRREHGARTIATELAFGLPARAAPAVEIALRDGRTVRVRGKADRIDRWADGRLVVIDYKTGSPRRTSMLDHDDPVPGGCGLQLPVYAARGAGRYGTPDTPVDAYYWFVGRGNNARIGYEVDAPVDEPRSTRPCARSSTASRPGCSSRCPRRRGRADRSSPAGTAIPTGSAPPNGGGNGNATGMRPSSRATARCRGRRRRRRGRRVTAQPALFPIPTTSHARAAIRTNLDATMFVQAGAGTGKTARARRPRRRARDRRRSRTAGPDGARRRDHLHREGRGGAPRPHRSRAATASRRSRAFGGRARSCRGRARRARRRRDLHAARVRAAHPHRRSRSRPGCRRASSCATRSRRGSRSRTRWRAFVDELLDDPELEQTVLVMLAANLRMEQLRAVAEVLDDNWDLLDRVPAAPALPALALDGWLAELDAVCAAASDCRFDDDKLLARLGELAEYRDALRSAFDDAARDRVVARAEAVVPRPKRRSAGQLARRRCPPGPDRATRRATGRRDRRSRRRRDQAARRRGRTVHRACGGRTAGRGRARIPRSARARTRAAARRRACARIRARSCGERYQRILIDEFQDTDPIQIDLAALLGSLDDTSGAGEVVRSWRDSRSSPGALFFVGDPKQSIYRFRRADIATFLDAAERFADPAPEFLTCNFRTAPGRARVDQPRVRRAHPARIRAHSPSTARSTAARVVPSEHDHRVVLLGAEAHTDDADADELRRAKLPTSRPPSGARSPSNGRCRIRRRARGARPASATCASCCRRARRSASSNGRSTRRRSRTGRRRARSCTRAARSAISSPTLRAVDDPSDELSLVTALRSSLFGCGDDDLFVYHVEHGGRWDVRDAPPESLPADHPVRRRDASCLGALHDARAVVDAERAVGACRARAPGRRSRRARRPVPRRRRAACGSWSTRRARSKTPRAARCATTSRGPSCKAPKARGSSRPCSPRPTTTRCASSRSTAPRVSSSRS